MREREMQGHLCWQGQPRGCRTSWRAAEVCTFLAASCQKSAAQSAAALPPPIPPHNPSEAATSEPQNASASETLEDVTEGRKRPQHGRLGKKKDADVGCERQGREGWTLGEREGETGPPVLEGGTPRLQG